MKVRLIAEREVRQQVRSKAFKLATGLVTAAIVAAIVVPTLLDDEAQPHRVGVVGRLTPERRDAIRQAGRLAGDDVVVVQVRDGAAADRRLKAGDLDLAVVEGPALVVENPLDETTRLARLAGAVSQALQLQGQLERAGLSPGEAAQALRAPPLRVRSLEQPDPDEKENAGIAFLGSLVLYILLLTYGSWIVASVVQEKSSRVVEVLLSAVRPVDILVGKVLGIGAVALGQALVFAGAAYAASLAVGFAQLPEGTPWVIASALLWLVLGFGFYSFAYATAASLASRQEDAQSASMPLAVVLIVSYFAGAGAVSEPGALPVRVLSFLPPTAPIVMPARAAVGGVAWWEVPVAVALVLAATYGMARLAAHIYPRVALHSGARLTLRRAWRASAG